MSKMNDLSLLDELLPGDYIMGFQSQFCKKLEEVSGIIFRYNHLSPTDKDGLKNIIRDLFIGTGERFVINRPFHCDFGNIEIGEDFTGNFNLTILDEAKVTFGDHAFIGPNVSIYTVEHALDPEERNMGLMRARPVTIGHNVWIGGSTIIMPGVTIGDNTVIGAGSLVTKDIPAGVLAYGSPCRVARNITEKDRLNIK